MSHNITKNMTVGSPAKLILAFAMPLLVGNIFQQLYNMVDTIIVGRYIGVNALAAVGSTGSINFLVLGFVMGLAQGLSILVAQYYGAEDYVNIRKSITMSAYLYFIVGIIVTIISVIFSKQLLLILNTPDNIITEADAYIKIIFAGILVTILFNFFSGILRALGDGKTPLYALFISSAVNIVLDIFFIVILKSGVAGAAYATVIAQFVSSVFCFYKIHKIEIIRIHKSDWKFDFHMFAYSFKLGMPVAFMNSVTAVGVMVIQFVINGYGALYVAAYSAGSKIIIILEQISVTFGSAIATYAGQNLGAGKLKRIKEGVTKINIILLFINIACGVLVIVFGKNILSLFVSASEAEVINIGYEVIVVTNMFLWILGVLWIYRSTLQAIGDTFIPMLSGILEFASRIFFAMLLPGFIGFRGVLFSEVSAWFTASVMLVIAYYYRINKLKNKEQENARMKVCNY